MIINLKRLEASPELIPITEVDLIFKKSRSTVTRFINVWGVKKVRDGRRSYVSKESLLQALNRVDAVSSELLKQEKIGV